MSKLLRHRFDPGIINNALLFCNMYSLNSRFGLSLVFISWEVNYLEDFSGRRLTYVWRSRGRRVQCNIEEVKVFESLRDLRVDPDLDAPAPPPPPSRRSNPSDVVLRAPLYSLLHFA